LIFRVFTPLSQGSVNLCELGCIGWDVPVSVEGLRVARRARLWASPRVVTAFYPPSALFCNYETLAPPQRGGRARECAVDAGLVQVGSPSESASAHIKPIEGHHRDSNIFQSERLRQRSIKT